MFNRILMVCVGNVCRSPMAVAVLRDRLGRRGVPITVESAGLSALVGRAAEPLAQAVMRERGLDLSGHRARQLTPEIIRSFELVLVMEARQQPSVEAMLPSARGRVHRIGRWGDFDVPDPFGRQRPAYERSLSLIERGLGDLERAFWPARG
jgi:low molecular weight protein-tyrosine phosphatase